ncbi:MAG: hypothetical protein BWZ10_02242 [candidate division BRC1 bacterium ADurb.BinA364]|nr:MAG: hypothetical protein BWZ10_02242 [candidate division BRC1 bacterium ADurb.BinA364]
MRWAAPPAQRRCNPGRWKPPGAIASQWPADLAGENPRSGQFAPLRSSRGERRPFVPPGDPAKPLPPPAALSRNSCLAEKGGPRRSRSAPPGGNRPRRRLPGLRSLRAAAPPSAARRQTPSRRFDPRAGPNRRYPAPGVAPPRRLRPRPCCGKCPARWRSAAPWRWHPPAPRRLRGLRCRAGQRPAPRARAWRCESPSATDAGFVCGARFRGERGE